LIVDWVEVFKVLLIEVVPEASPFNRWPALVIGSPVERFKIRSSKRRKITFQFTILLVDSNMIQTK
jgi:hypothetical protein